MLLVVTATVSASPSLLALDPGRAGSQCVHQVWRAEQGLPLNTIDQIAHTADGYLWVSTREGLARFDGVRFTLLDLRAAAGASDKGVGPLLSHEGSLFVGSSQGLFRMKDGAFTTYGVRDGLLHGDVTSLAPGRDGSLLVATREGVSRLKGGTLATVVKKAALTGSAPPFTVLEDPDGDLWIGSRQGLYRLREGHVERYTTANGLPNDWIAALCRARDGALWIGTMGGGLVRFVDGAFATFGRKDGLSDEAVGSIVEDRDGNLWLGTGKCLDRIGGGVLSSFTKQHGLLGNGIIGIHEDREGSLWFGTLGGGLHRLRDGKLLPYTETEGLASDSVWSVHEDRRGALWMGTEGGGISRFAGGTFTTFTTRDGLADDNAITFCDDPDGNLWIGTTSGVSRFRGGSFTTLHARDGFREDEARFLVDRDGSLWATAEGEGLTRFQHGKRADYGAKDGLPAATPVLSLAEDRGGTIWVGTARGLYRSRPDGRVEEHAAEALGSRPVYPTLPDRSGALWIYTRTSLYRMRDGRLVPFAREQGLPPDNPWRPVDDGQGNLWFAWRRGVFRASVADVEAVAAGRTKRVATVSYGTEDGMRNAECVSGGTRSRDGRIWFPTEGGVAVVDPARIPTNTVPPPVVVEEVLVDGGRPQPAKGSPLLLRPGTAKLEIRYTATSLVVPKRVKFKVRLEGFDPDWVDAGTERAVRYTNLPPRAYTFRVIACNDDGLWNETGASLAVTLLPHFWQTKWFLGVEVLAALGVVAGALLIQRRRLEAQKAVELRLADLDRKTEELEQARRVQLALLPEEPLTVGSFTVAGRMQTATEVGGDYYGYMKAGGRLCVVIGDATGHGMSSGLVAGMLKSALATLSRTEVSGLAPSRWLSDLNEALRTSISRRGLGVCAGIALVDVDSGVVELGMAGVPNPFLVSSSGAVERLQLSGTPLGYVKKIVTATATRTLAPGDRLVLLTDGLVEQTNGAGEEWGYEGIEAALAALVSPAFPGSPAATPEGIAEALLAACERHGAGQPRTDDRTVVVLARRADGGEPT